MIGPAISTISGGESMARAQGATPPAWLGRSRISLLLSALGGPRQNADKLRHLGSLAAALVRPRIVHERLARLCESGAHRSSSRRSRRCSLPRAIR